MSQKFMRSFISENWGLGFFISGGLSIGEGALLKIRKIPPEEIGQH